MDSRHKVPATKSMAGRYFARSKVSVWADARLR
jgi:hypothetical protein